MATGRQTERPALRATANLLSPSTRAEREDIVSRLAGGGTGGGGGLQAGGFEREGAPDLNWKRVLVRKDYRPSLWDAHAP